MAVSLTRYYRLKKRLKREHKKTGSWRTLARQYPPIKFGTLQRFATELTYLPKDKNILIALGLLKPQRIKNKIALPEWLLKIKKKIRLMQNNTCAVLKP